MSQIDEIKSRIDIVELVESYFPLIKSGRNLKALCPFHSEKTPSFMVSPELQIFKCFGCFPSGSFVKTEQGLRPIESIEAGENVFTHQGKLEKVRLKFKRNYEGNLVKIKLWKMGKEVCLTEDHKIFVLRGTPYLHQKYKYLSRRLKKIKGNLTRNRFLERFEKHFSIEKIKADDLQKGDYLLYPIIEKVKDVSVLDLKQFIKRKLPPHGTKPRKISYKVKVNEEFLKLLGYYIAEGSSHRAYIRFSLGLQEEDLVQEIRQILKELFGLDIGVHRRVREHGSGIEISCCHSFLADIFRNICGTRANNKHIPFVLQFLSPKKQKILLEAIHRGDGCMLRSSKSGKKFFSITTISPILKDQVRDILLRLGYFPTISINKAHVDKKGINHKESYAISWSKEAQSRYNLSIRLRNGNLFWVLPIYKLQKSKYSGPVYNLNVGDDHSFVADSFVVGNCGEGGDIFTFVQKMENMEFPDALKILAEKAGVELKKEYFSPEDKERQVLFGINHLAGQFFHHVLVKHPAGKQALEYLKNRGIDKKTIDVFGLGYAPNSWHSLTKFLLKRKYEPKLLLQSGLIKPGQKGDNFYDFFRHRLMFPLKNSRGQVIGFSGRALESQQEPKYINIHETPIFKKGSFFFGLDLAKKDIRQKDQVIVAEGEFDMITPFINGTQNIVASKGTSLTIQQLKELSRFTKNIILCFDQDTAGQKAVQRTLELAESLDLNLKVILLPKEFKDPDDLARQDKELWQKLVLSPVSIYDFYFTFAKTKFNLTDPYDQKKFGNFLFPIIGRINNEIVRAGYIKKISQLLDLDQEAIIKAITKAKPDQFDVQQPASTTVQKSVSKTTEEYFLVLLLKSDSDHFEKRIKQVDEEDFGNETLKHLFSQMKSFAKQEKSFEIKAFNDILEGIVKEVFSKLILWDLGEIGKDKEKFLKEEERTYQALKIAALERELKGLGKEIKKAEEQEASDEVLEKLHSNFQQTADALNRRRKMQNH